MWTTVVIMAVCVAVMGGIAMIGTGGLKGNAVQAAIMFVVLPLIACYGFVSLGVISGG